MAIAIVAFAVVSLVALLPAGLDQFRKAMNARIGAQISQQVVTDPEQTDFDHLLASAECQAADFYVLPMRYFDDQGTDIVLATLGSPTSAEAAKIIYHVRVRGAAPGPLDTSLTSDTFTSLPATQDSLRFHPRDSSS
jgi:uncharacterized protein (TIGR02598 family)